MLRIKTEDWIIMKGIFAFLFESYLIKHLYCQKVVQVDCRSLIYEEGKHSKEGIFWVTVCKEEDKKANPKLVANLEFLFPTLKSRPKWQWSSCVTLLRSERPPKFKTWWLLNYLIPFSIQTKCKINSVCVCVFFFFLTHLHNREKRENANLGLCVSVHTVNVDDIDMTKKLC